jgi:hypothetical protein
MLLVDTYNTLKSGVPTRSACSTMVVVPPATARKASASIPAISAYLSKRAPACSTTRAIRM